jgi:enterochelin esterase family protein
MAVSVAAEPRVHESQVTFTLPDPGREFERVVLAQELVRPRLGPPFRRRGRSWELRFPRLEVDRMEYALGLTRAGGGMELTVDPTNPLRAPGPFGDKSVIEFPGYAPPEWLDDDEPPAGEVATVEIGSRRLAMQAILWASEGTEPGEPLPLLVAHDGPEYAEFSALLRFLEWATSFGELPPMRAALLPPPGDRNSTYSASAVYSRMLMRDALPQLQELVPWPEHRPPVLMGASLGGLAALHLHWLNPASVGGLFLQSGSFFRQRSDRQESGFERFRRITRFVGEVLRGREFAAPIPVAMTCGLQEENLLNNRAVANALRGEGYDVAFAEVRDAHNWVAWRDAFDPHLVDLLTSVWG